MRRVFCSVGTNPFADVLPGVIDQQGLILVTDAALADIVISDNRSLIELHVNADVAKMGILCLLSKPIAGAKFPSRTAILRFTGCKKRLRRNAVGLLTPAATR